MKPILFNTEMVRAILSGRKTMTRRTNKMWNDFCEPLPDFIDNKARTYAIQNYGNREHTDYLSMCEVKMPICEGDILYVRETWCTDEDIADVFEENLIHGFYYRADNTDMDWVNDKEIVKWRPSIHMPKEAARIFLKVTNVRVERLQDISESDCVKEGCTKSYADMEDKLCDYCPLPDESKGTHCYGGNPVMCEGACCKEAYENYLEDNAVNEFQDLWDSTIQKKDIAKYGWNANPWVFVYQFDRCEKPVGEVKE